MILIRMDKGSTRKITYGNVMSYALQTQTIEQFNRIKNDAEEFYNDIGTVRCPYFQGDINFNIKGWEHLIFKSWNKTRSIQDQYSRLRHLKLAPTVLVSSKTLQGIWTTQKMERAKKKRTASGARK